ncbi:hypothetical protein ABIE26_004814 [Pedobacter africanus]|uniref:Uncharacterized protein n=1 Tax=Pedobacter africanus TaxID=151894 RepID=A0ACC6L2R2_9SPHI|nr:DUF6520 family protein [Pedobacter africanus]MDR6785717.1 hypothetical protein [Pedobacter africanus]
MKKVIFTALVAIVAVGGAFASVFTPAKKQPANVYTYYVEGDCNTPVYCSAEFEGPVCSLEYQGLTVYDSQGCLGGHEVSNILGRKQP